MTSETLKLAAQIVRSHASMTELTPTQLVEEIKKIYDLLASLEGEEPAEAATPTEEAKAEELTPSEEAEAVAEEVKKPPIPLREIVKAKYVVCLECGKKMRTLKAHLRKAHNLSPKEYLQRYGLDPKKFPQVFKKYSEKLRKSAIDRGLGNKLKRKETKPR